MNRLFHPLLIVSVLASAAGFFFASVSTGDFVAHLDRQVHGIHCSFLPGISDVDQSGESGCHSTLMSPYSSFLRSSIWGGIPIALPAMAVFSFLGFWSVWVVLNRRSEDSRATGILFFGSLVPLLSSCLMGYLSLVELDAACKLCIGIYAASCVLSLSSFLAHHRALGVHRKETAPRTRLRPLSWAGVLLAIGSGGATVLSSVGVYAAAAPNFASYVGSCGELAHTSKKADVLLPLGAQKGRVEMLEVLDPLCPSCRGFEHRLSKMPEANEVDRQVLLFPLDDTCNWMLDRAIHPGACSVSEAVLCAADPMPVIEWAFANQVQIMEASEKTPGAAEKMARAQFPDLASCIGSPQVKARLNQSLRWAVDNQLEVLTPQVFVNGIRLCGEDTDLGLDFALPRLIAMAERRPKTVGPDKSKKPTEESLFAATPERSETVQRKKRNDTEPATTDSDLERDGATGGVGDSEAPSPESVTPKKRPTENSATPTSMVTDPNEPERKPETLEEPKEAPPPPASLAPAGTAAKESPPPPEKPDPSPSESTP